MALSVSKKIDTVVNSAQIMGIEIKELFLNERDYSELERQSVDNRLSKNDPAVLTYQSIIGLIKISKG